MENSGERFIPTNCNVLDVPVNLERYLYAIEECQDKVVIDAGCGCGLGTYLYSLVAKKVYAIDYNKDALKYAGKFPFGKNKVEFLHRNMNTDLLPEADVCVALEFIEHLENPDFFLDNLKCEKLVFSIPLNSLPVSKWHIQDFKGLEDIKKLLEKYYSIPEYFIQNNKWTYGSGIKKEKQV